MRLINCANLNLVEVADCSTINYAILSHTWEEGEEVQWDEFVNRTATEKRGWEKIQKACSLAIADGYDFLWCDTCCINKSSSAELTEAINSMFPWYAKSSICYAYLADYDQSTPGSIIGASRWFTRGWTLQELIAPTRIRFYDASWTDIGTKASLCNDISKITGIEQKVLQGFEGCDLSDVLSQVPVARRMSWAARRQTTRVEDVAYCLLGIFGVNLPLLYGEGERAFIRLQEEIIKGSNDLSVFAWRSADCPSSNSSCGCFSGVFASHPSSFRDSGHIDTSTNLIFDPNFTLTNKGVKIKTRLEHFGETGLHGMLLNCHDAVRPSESQLGIFLKHQGASVFARARPHEFTTTASSNSEHKTLFLSRLLSQSMAKSLHTVHRWAFVIPNLPHPFCNQWTTNLVEPKALWDSGKRLFITAGLDEFVGCCEFKAKDTPYVEGDKQIFLFFGYGYGLQPWLKVITGESMSSLSGLLGNWKRVAERLLEIRDVGKTFFSIHHGGTSISALTITLIHGTRDGEPVFLIDYQTKLEQCRLLK